MPLRTRPATSSPSHATCHSARVESGSADESLEVALDRLARDPSGPGTPPRPRPRSAGGAPGSPAGSRGRRESARRGSARRAAGASRSDSGTARSPARLANRRRGRVVRPRRPPNWCGLSGGRRSLRDRARARASAQSSEPRARGPGDGARDGPRVSSRWLTTAGRSRQLCRASPIRRPSTSMPWRSRTGDRTHGARQLTRWQVLPRSGTSLARRARLIRVISSTIAG